MIITGREAGHFRAESPAMTALAVLSPGIDVARWYRDDGGWPPEKIGEHYGELALRTVGCT